MAINHSEREEGILFSYLCDLRTLKLSERMRDRCPPQRRRRSSNVILHVVLRSAKPRSIWFLCIWEYESASSRSIAKFASRSVILLCSCLTCCHDVHTMLPASSSTGVCFSEVLGRYLCEAISSVDDHVAVTIHREVCH